MQKHKVEQIITSMLSHCFSFSRSFVQRVCHHLMRARQIKKNEVVIALVCAARRNCNFEHWIEELAQAHHSMILPENIRFYKETETNTNHTTKPPMHEVNECNAYDYVDGHHIITKMRDNFYTISLIPFYDVHYCIY